MKKLSVLIAAIMLLCFSCTASAAGKIYRNPAYNFSFLQKVYVTEIDNRTEEALHFYPATAAEEQLLAALLAGAEKEAVLVFDARSGEMTGDREALPQQKNLREARLKVTINRLGYEMRQIPGRYEQKTEYVRQYRKDRYGKESYVEVPIVRDVYIPPKDVPMAIISLVYTVSAAEGDTVLASWSDQRSREYEYEVDSMLERSCKEFFKQLTKK